jgi:hypothetical protein
MDLNVGNGIHVSCNGNHTDWHFPTTTVTVKYMMVIKVKKESEKT